MYDNKKYVVFAIEIPVRQCYNTHRKRLLSEANSSQIGESSKYNPELKEFSRDYGTNHICQENGEQVMYESYAQLQPGDGQLPVV